MRFPILRSALRALVSAPAWLCLCLLLPVSALAQETTGAIEVGESSVSDTDIDRRIADIYANLPDLGAVDVSVDSGVVRLSGTVADRDAADQAAAIAGRVTGVVSVADNIEVALGIGQRMRHVLADLRDRFFQLLALAPLLLVAGLVFCLFWVLARMAARRDALYRRLSRNPFLQDLLRQVVRGLILLVGFIVALQILDATALLGTILGAAGILGLAIGFAIRDTVENYLASILLSLRQPFAANDHVIIEGHEGLIMRLTTRETVLMTLDGNHIRIPNATVYKSVITNYTRNPKRRFTFDVGVDTAVGLNAARTLGTQTLAATAGVLDEPPPRCNIHALGDSNVLLRMSGWVDQSSSDFGKVRGEAIRAVKRAFDEADYEMPEPIYRVRLDGHLPGGPPSAPSEAPRPAPPDDETVQPDIAREAVIEEQIREEKQADGEQDLLARE